jgi:hypothetical protein
VLRRTMRQRWQAKLQAVKAELWQRLHHSIPEQGAYLRSVIAGHVRCYGVPRQSGKFGRLPQSDSVAVVVYAHTPQSMPPPHVAPYAAPYSTVGLRPLTSVDFIRSCASAS